MYAMFIQWHTKCKNNQKQNKPGKKRIYTKYMSTRQMSSFHWDIVEIR